MSKIKGDINIVGLFMSDQFVQRIDQLQYVLLETLATLDSSFHHADIVCSFHNSTCRQKSKFHIHFVV